jgi:ribonucleotide monophosphatase NagD (HAD superfamily)
LDQADWMLTTGLPKQELYSYFISLDYAKKRNLPLVCANPDVDVRLGQDLHPCSGALAYYFDQMGGKVFFRGKPYSHAYETCFAQLNLEKSTILAVGDAFRTDIFGAHQAQIDSLLILSGIHAQYLMEKENISSELDQLSQDYGCRPTYFLPYLSW